MSQAISTRLTLSVLSISFWIYRIHKKEELLCDILLNKRRSWKWHLNVPAAAVSSIDVKKQKKGDDLVLMRFGSPVPILLSKCLKKGIQSNNILFRIFQTDQYAGKRFRLCFHRLSEEESACYNTKLSTILFFTWCWRGHASSLMGLRLSFKSFVDLSPFECQFPIIYRIHLKL